MGEVQFLLGYSVFLFFVIFITIMGAPTFIKETPGKCFDLDYFKKITPSIPPALAVKISTELAERGYYDWVRCPEGFYCKIDEKYEIFQGVPLRVGKCMLKVPEMPEIPTWAKVPVIEQLYTGGVLAWYAISNLLFFFTLMRVSSIYWWAGLLILTPFTLVLIYIIIKVVRGGG